MNLAKERTELFQDLYRGRVPKRVPIVASFPLEFCIQYAGRNLVEAQWDTGQLEPIFAKTCQDFISDVVPFGSNRFPSYYKILGAKTFIMSSAGYLQHPEVHGLQPEEYDSFNASPFDFMVETIMPRLYTALDCEPTQKAVTMAKAMKAYFDEVTHSGLIRTKLAVQYGYAQSPPLSGAFTEAPFDFLADILRGFTGIIGDIRRYPDKVLDACSAVTPMMIKRGIPPNPSIDGQTAIPLHMGPFLREKDFAKFYWPSFKQLIEELASRGQGIFLFVEQDWMRYLDYLYDLPSGIRMRFEYGDPKLVKEKLGDKHIISGFYPVNLLRTGTRQECIDKAKELIDILAPGGRYSFNFDKVIMSVDNVNLDNLKAVLQYVYENTDY